VEIACIVEGDGEEQAPPVLVSRIIAEAYPDLYVRTFIATNFRGRDKFQDRVLVQRAVDSAARRINTGGAVLMLLDADDDCPVQLGDRLLGWAREARSDILTSVVVANREYEAWFLAAAESLQGHRGLPVDLKPPFAADSVRGAKEWLVRNMRRAEPYGPTRHQASFSARIDLGLARQNSRSFRKLEKEVRRLVEELQAALD
jgi:hypothetical protein